MDSQACILRLLFLLSACLPLVGGTCLPNAIRPDDRQALSGGDSVRFATSERGSAQILTAVAQVIVEEVLGYHVLVETTPIPWIRLAGCTVSGPPTLVCGGSRDHVMVDAFYTAELPEGVEAPQDLGSLGFSHHEHLWVQGLIQSAALDQGLLLDHFRTYNSSLTAAASYFHAISAFNTTDLSRCDEAFLSLEASHGMKLYMEKTSDLEGTVVVAGQLRRKCNDDYWWLSPGCRIYSDCIPLLLRDLEGIPSVMLFATAYSIPLAVARAKNLETFVRLVKETNVLFYWWSPDSTFAELQPQQVFLPGGHFGNHKRAGKGVSSDLKEQAPLVWELISRMLFLEDEVLELLQVNTSEFSAREVACAWLLSADRWREWLSPPECGETAYWHSSGQCRECQRGSRCQLEPVEPRVLPGFYARKEDPYEIFQCFGFDASRCTGGPAGSCAGGRDPASLTCSACLPGYMTAGAECVQCAGAWPYLHFVLLIFVRLFAIGSLYFLLIMASSRRSTSTSLLHAEIGACELLTFLQIVALMHQFNLAWSEPILLLWQALELFKFDAVFYAPAAQCFLSMKENVIRYAGETFVVPLLFLTVPAFYHLFDRQNLDGQPLRRTIGTLFVVYFISMCGTLTAPFRCQTHPNQLQTLQAFPEIFCNFQGEHLELVVIFAAGSLIPTTFLAYCFWIMCQYPERLHNGDSKFVRSCAFLTLRLRPGEGLFSLFLLCRNLLLVLCPLFDSSGSGLAAMSLLLMASLVVTVSRHPWRAKGSNLMDILMHVCLLFILDLIELHEFQMDARTGSPDGGGGETLGVTLAVLLVLLAFLITIMYGVLSYFRIRCRKPFHFFICHHKAGAGALARLIKMELQRRIPLVHVFVDSDQLSDLTEPLCYVGYEVETLILLGSPKVLFQKWCVAEMAIARLQNIPSVVVQLPDFCMPDASFITNYMISAPQMHDLVSYGIEVREIRATILWVCKLEVLRLPDLQPRSVNSVIDSLTDSHGPALNMSCTNPSCAILADPENLMATATAYVLWGLLNHEFFMQGIGSCIVPHTGQDLPSDMTSMLFICSEGCFETQQVLEWLFQACDMPGCFVLPVLIGDHFQFPSADFYAETFKNHNLDDAEYHQAFIETVFLEAAGTFSPAISPGVELAHQTSQLLQRIKLRTRTDRVKQARPLGRSHSFADPGDRLKMYLRKQSTMINRMASMLFTASNNKKPDTVEGASASSRSSLSTHSSSWALRSEPDGPHKGPDVYSAELDAAEEMTEAKF